jgi:hypothetical protein
VVRQSLLTKSFNIASDELERARYCAKEQGVSLNKFLRLAVTEKTRGVLQGLETTGTLKDIRATVRESEARHVLALESALADMRVEVAAAVQANEDLVMKTLQAFSQFLSSSEPSQGSPRNPGPEAATAPSSATSLDWQRYASGS